MNFYFIGTFGGNIPSKNELMELIEIGKGNIMRSVEKDCQTIAILDPNTCSIVI